MRIVLQRVSEATVTVERQEIGAIQTGFLIFLGIEDLDDQSDADWLLKKVMGMRVFSDEEGKMNLNIEDVNGALLIVSQFTLHASTKKGNRPSFIKAARPEKAIPLYEYFVAEAKKSGLKIATGTFGAHMDIALVNDGPVTIQMDSKQKE